MWLLHIVIVSLKELWVVWEPSQVPYTIRSRCYWHFASIQIQTWFISFHLGGLGFLFLNLFCFKTCKNKENTNKNRHFFSFHSYLCHDIIGLLYRACVFVNVQIDAYINVSCWCSSSLRLRPSNPIIPLFSSTQKTNLNSDFFVRIHLPQNCL